MNNALNAFNTLMQQTDTAKGLYCYLEDQKVPIDASDLLRWQWVLAVSALDKYIHDIVRIGMIQIFKGTRNITGKYKTFCIDMLQLENIKNASFPENEFEKIIVLKHGFLAFQNPKNITDALSYIWDESHKWEAISKKMKTQITSQDLITKLNNIVLRRNQIVHEGDSIPCVIPLTQQAINKSDVEEVISFISEVAEAIYLNIK